MDGLLLLIGAAVLVITWIGYARECVATLTERLGRRYPDEALPVLRSFVRRGCEFDYEKYLQCQVTRAHRRMLHAEQRYRDLYACLHPVHEASVQKEAAIRAAAAPSREFSISNTFYHGQVRAAQRRVN